MYEPPFDPTDKITATALDIAEMVGRLAPDSALSSSPVLHRELRIKTYPEHPVSEDRKSVV